MTRERIRESAFSRKLKEFDDWMETEFSPLKGKIDITGFLAVSTVLLSLSAFLYLREFYAQFGIRYFKFPSFEDAILVLYDKGSFFFPFPNGNCSSFSRAGGCRDFK